MKLTRADFAWANAHTYVASIRNEKKKDYATRFLEALQDLEHGSDFDDVDVSRNGLSYMGRQAVRMRLRELLEEP